MLVYAIVGLALHAFIGWLTRLGELASRIPRGGAGSPAAYSCALHRLLPGVGDRDDRQITQSM
jgi:hypothetical protein